ARLLVPKCAPSLTTRSPSMFSSKKTMKRELIFFTLAGRRRQTLYRRRCPGRRGSSWTSSRWICSLSLGWRTGCTDICLRRVTPCELSRRPLRPVFHRGSQADLVLSRLVEQVEVGRADV